MSMNRKQFSLEPSIWAKSVDNFKIKFKEVWLENKLTITFSTELLWYQLHVLCSLLLFLHLSNTCLLLNIYYIPDTVVLEILIEQCGSQWTKHSSLFLRSLHSGIGREIWAYCISNFCRLQMVISVIGEEQGKDDGAKWWDGGANFKQCGNSGPLWEGDIWEKEVMAGARLL